MRAAKASNNLEIIDFDAKGELFSAWSAGIPADLRARVVVERTPSGGYHVIYRCEGEVCGNMKLAQRRSGGAGDKIVTLIETRGEGGLCLYAPTSGYEVIQGDLCDLPVLTAAERDVLLRTAWELNEYVPPVGNGPTHTSGGGAVGQRGPSAAVHSEDASHHTDRPGDDFNRRGDPRNVLEQHGWVRVKGGQNEYWRRPGETSGWSASLKDGVFYVFSANAAPFEPNRAYSPFSVYTLLNHGGDWAQAAGSLRLLGYGGDPRNSLADHPNGADISAIVRMSAAPGADGDEQTPRAPEITDPGPIPEQLFRVPGFVASVMGFTLANAPYPNVGLAFCGAIALQSYLCGRKVCDPGDLRPNLYLLALASSGTGKEFPRKINSRVLFEIGQVAALGDKFASGEGIQDALACTSAMLFQNRQFSISLSQNTLRGQVSAVQAESDPRRPCPYGYDREIVGPDGALLYRVRHFPGRIRKVLDKDGNVTAVYRKSQTLRKPGKDCKGKLVLSEPQRVPAVRDIFAWCLDGVGFFGIADRLNARGLPSPRGNLWAHTTVKAIIENPVYRGDLVWNRRTKSKFYAIKGGRVDKMKQRNDSGKPRLLPEEDWIVIRDVLPTIVSRDD